MALGAVVASICVAVGAFVQGWDTSAIAGGLLYLVPDLDIETSPQLQGAVISTNLICAVLSAGLSGPAADWLGRRVVLINAALLFLLAGIIMAFSQTIYQLLLGRAFVGISNGILVSLAPLYIAEVSPPEIRGRLSTLPQLAGSLGLVAAYTMDFIVSLGDHPNWRFMLGAMVVPSATFLLCTLWLVPESPRWLVSKGYMAEASEVLKKLLNREDVTGELALQVEGLHVGAPDSTIQEWALKPAGSEEYGEQETPVIKVFGGEDGAEWIATPLLHEEEEQEIWDATVLGHSLKSHPLPVDPLVSLLEGVQDVLHESELRHARGIEGREAEDDHEGSCNTIPELEGLAWSAEDSLKAPLLQREKKREESVVRQNSGNRGGLASLPHGRLLEHDNSLEAQSSHPDVQSSHPESMASSLQAGGGFMLTYEWEEGRGGGNGEREAGAFKRVFLLEEPSPLVALATDVHIPASQVPGESEILHTAAIISSQHAETIPENANGPAMIHPSVTAKKGPLWSAIGDPGVRRALFVGVGIQLLQQATGISAIMGYAPMIFKESGADFVQKIGITPNSASIFFSGFTCLLMLPAIAVAMKLMDTAGRRYLLLRTAPFVGVSMAMLSLTSAVLQPGPLRMLLSLLAVAGYTTSFVMGFGPIPAIFCSEIFPTRARGLCMGICIVAQWLGGIIVSQTFPLLLVYTGMPVIFGIYALMTCVAWVFAYMRVPETKGLPLEVIIEFFSLSASKDVQHE